MRVDLNLIARPEQMMRIRKNPACLRPVLALALCLAFFVWTVSPGADHAPRVLETIQDHIQMIAEHGHSHGFEEDLFWALHGHDHESADHEHSQVFLMETAGPAPLVDPADTWNRWASAHGPPRPFRIERPPRA